MEDYFPQVVQALAGDNRMVYAYFSDGSVRLFDVAPLIERGGVFAQLADDAFFRERLAVLNDAVAWDVTGDLDPTTCIDLDPITTYEHSAVVRDPLETVA